ncbi:MAG TPA: hypothetical protein VF064_20705 [Pyrinomonadaceae bacterium]
MSRLCMQVFAIALCFAAFAPAYGVAQERPQRRVVAAVEKVHVGDMGADDEADRFRLLLEEQLTKKGFTVVRTEAEADAVLTGVLSVRVYDRKTEARVFVRLTSRDGAQLWARDFGHKRLRINPFSLQEPTRRRAEEVAEAMRREFK